MLIAIDERDSRPIYLQIIRQIKAQVRDGQLRPGQELPSVRELADTLGINLHTVRHAYGRLRDQGIIHFRLGQRARVSAPRMRPASREEIERDLLPRLEELITDAFHLGLTPKELKKLIDEALGAEK
jgi:GntR family transcriptional regulator